LFQKAKDLGLNISKITENTLKGYVERLEGQKTETNGGQNLYQGAKGCKDRWALRLPYERVLAEEDVASVHDA